MLCWHCLQVSRQCTLHALNLVLAGQEDEYVAAFVACVNLHTAKVNVSIDYSAHM
jgi:hypothetical protein